MKSDARTNVKIVILAAASALPSQTLLKSNDCQKTVNAV